MFAKISIRSLALPFLALPIVALAVSAAHAVQASADKPTEYSEYRNDQWRFSLVVPDDMTAQVHDQPGDGQTIQFLDEIGDYLRVAVHATGSDAPPGRNARHHG
jgi:hypothetical protein